jgi:CRP-like cAMP-binding protein
MTLLKHLSSIISISEKLEKEILAVAKEVTFQKQEHLIDAGDKCNDLLFVQKGILRGYYTDEDGKEITNWFAEENEFATCFYAFVAQQPSFENIQALEDCKVVRLSNTALQSLYLKFPETERIGRIITENYYIRLEERLLNIQFKTAKERYQNLILSKPGLLQRASLGQIATYLGITQETLSRIRA